MGLPRSILQTLIAKKLEHEIMVHCKANPSIRVIDAIAVVFNDERMRLGIKMSQ
jgi:hypothetical protein